MTELFELLERHGFRHVSRLGIPWNEVPKIFPRGGLSDAGVPGEIDHETVLPADLARQKIDECLLQSPGAGVFNIELEHFLEPQLVQDLGHSLRILDGAWDFRRQEI